MSAGRTVETTLVIIAALLVLAVCKLAQAVLEPVVFAVFIIMIAWPTQKALQASTGKALALVVTVVATIAVVLALLGVIVWGGGQVVDWVNQHLERIQETLLASTSWLEKHDIFVLTLLSDHFNSAQMVRLLQRVVIQANTILAFALIVLLYVILGLVEAEAVAGRIGALQNRDVSQRLLTAGASINRKFRTYMLVRTIASALTGLAVWGFARLMGLEMAAACGVLAFALNYLPYLGSLIVTGFLAVFAFVQTGSPQSSLIVLGGVSLIQVVIGSYLEPVFSGEALAISPPVVLFTIVLWTYLWGALGAFLGVPLAIAAMTLLNAFPSTRWIADILSGGRTRAEPGLDGESLAFERADPR
ncbi:MAG: AI-2E family transporter [Methylocystis sp.]|uniref:AI-2E family transporter n=1 Tax=Methylocystis sp. TaxID=1911079 RepID=UPI003DA5F9A1